MISPPSSGPRPSSPSATGSQAGIPGPLLRELEEIGPAIESAEHRLILLDFDGTLAPIVEFPWLATIPASTLATLMALAATPGCTVGIVSGRALDDVWARVGVDGLVYSGNHGLEIAGRGLRFDEPTAIELVEKVLAVGKSLRERVGAIPGVVIEPKGRSASVHYRRVRHEDWSEVERRVREVIPGDDPSFEVIPGKLVWEIRPRVDWNKGTAIRWIRESLGLQHAATIYLGDDRSDEYGFMEVGRFVSARVGAPQPTHAGYHIADTQEVAWFLSWILQKVRSRRMA